MFLFLHLIIRLLLYCFLYAFTIIVIFLMLLCFIMCCFCFYYSRLFLVTYLCMHYKILFLMHTSYFTCVLLKSISNLYVFSGQFDFEPHVLGEQFVNKKIPIIIIIIIIIIILLILTSYLHVYYKSLFLMHLSYFKCV